MRALIIILIIRYTINIGLSAPHLTDIYQSTDIALFGQYQYRYRFPIQSSKKCTKAEVEKKAENVDMLKENQEEIAQK
jgi:hypothetical protein